MKKILICLSVLTMMTSCVSKKKLLESEAKNKEIQDLLNSATVKLNSCLEEKSGLNASLSALRDQNNDLKSTNQGLISTSKDMTVLSTKGAQNIEKALETIKEKDLKISRMQDAFVDKTVMSLEVNIKFWLVDFKSLF